MDQRGDDAWNVDIFLGRRAAASFHAQSQPQPQSQSSSSSSRSTSSPPNADSKSEDSFAIGVGIGGGGVDKAASGEATSCAHTSDPPSDVSAAVVRHKRWSRCPDPEWPFRILWHLDIHFDFVVANANPNPNRNANADNDAADFSQRDSSNTLPHDSNNNNNHNTGATICQSTRLACRFAVRVVAKPVFLS